MEEKRRMQRRGKKDEKGRKTFREKNNRERIGNRQRRKKI